jgi:pimeloyl-ACP methyl ester carboxylesterase
MIPAMPRRRRLAAAAVMALTGGCAVSPQPSAIDRLQACGVDDGPSDAYCGTYQVFENRETQQGRRIALRLVVLPALSNQPQPDPIFFLAGGPGQGAAEMARPLREAFRSLQTDRDIVLVDQRGTGKSNPLDCKDERDSLAAMNEPDEALIARLKECLKGYDADPTLYTTTIAMDDLDEVRAYLGYDEINLIGGSYGTRAGLVYLRQHGDRVRVAVLDGVAPTPMRLPLSFARDAQRALDKLLDDCEKDEACRTKYPNLRGRTAALFTRLERTPPRVRLTHSRTGVAEEVTIDVRFVAGVIHASLYSPLASSLVPELIARAERNDFQAMLALATLNEPTADNMAIGMQLSVLCAEDHPFITPEEAVRESSGTLFGNHLMAWRQQACDMWPKGRVPADYHEHVRSDVPVLLLSGDLDPVTPPTWAAEAAKTLARSKHVIVSGTGHGVMATGCGMKMIRAFIRGGSLDAVDDSCAATPERPPFFLTPAGPDPKAGGKRAAS